MSLSNRLKRYQQKYYASGSPLRFLRKAALIVSKPGANASRARVGAKLTEKMSDAARKTVDELNRTGYAEAGPEIDPALLGELDKLATERLESGQKGRKLRSFFTALSTPDDLRSDHILTRFALQPGVQEVVCAYFGGKVPYLADLTLLLSHGSDEPKWKESQLWHRDYADSKTIKLWVYHTDVDTVEKGPFTYLPLDASGKVKNRLFPGRVLDEEVSAAGLDAEVTQVYGQRLKTFYIDTARCYHLGSRLKGENIRLAYVATFITHAPLYPISNKIKTMGSESEAERLFLTI